MSIQLTFEGSLNADQAHFLAGAKAEVKTIHLRADIDVISLLYYAMLGKQRGRGCFPIRG